MNAQLDDETYEKTIRRPWHVPGAHSVDAQDFPADDYEAALAQSLDFGDSQRAALATAEHSRQLHQQTDRLVNWLCAAIIVGVVLWAVFA